VEKKALNRKEMALERIFNKITID
jgi:hypothetical protein